MTVDVKVPEVGESVREALLAQWLKRDGETVRKDEILFVIETDKVTLEISAPADGVLKILIGEGQTVAVGTVVGSIDTAAAEAKPPARKIEAEKPPAEEAAAKPAPALRPEPVPPPPTAPAAPAEAKPVMSPSARELAQKSGVDPSRVTATGPGGRVTEGDILLYMEQGGTGTEARMPEEAPRAVPRAVPKPAPEAGEETFRKPMSPLRQRVAARLLEARRNTAMLTTFNEIDMSRVQALRRHYGEQFRQKYGVRLGMMSFFLKACVTALQEQPEVNAFIEGNEIVYHSYCHIGVAIGAERGLIVPVIRNAERRDFADLERTIVDFVVKIRENRLALSDLEGGTFTITNGGIFGSLLSTPILNPPQSAILGMHKIEDRPVVVDGQIVIRPMMYVAMSYDHRIIDGREAVTFLRRIKELVENPERMLMEV